MSKNIKNFVQNGKKIIGVGANYKELLKIKKMPTPKKPGIFLKPTSSYITEEQPIILPKGFSVNQEVELGLVIGKSGKHICEENALDYIGGYCIALDMTATCQIAEARKTGGSWTISKGFDTACPVSRFICKSEIEDPQCVQLWCSVNGKEVQNANTNDMVFKIPELIVYISKYMTLEPGDLIITGSPPGMGPVKNDDCVQGGIKDLVDIKFIVQCEE